MKCNINTLKVIVVSIICFFSINIVNSKESMDLLVEEVLQEKQRTILNEENIEITNNIVEKVIKTDNNTLVKGDTNKQSVKNKDKQIEVKKEIVLQENTVENKIIEQEILKPISLYQLIDLALERNQQTRQAWLSIKKSKFNIAIAKGDYYPTVNLASSLSSSGEKDHNDFSNAQSNTINAKLDLPIFGKTQLKVEQIILALEDSELQYNSVVKTLIANVIQVYFNTMALKEKERSALKTEEYTLNALKAAELKYKVGLVPLYDKLEANTAYANSKLQTIQIKNDLKKTYGQLNNILNLDPQYLLYLKDLNVAVSSDLDSFEFYLEEAKKNREELQILYNQKKVANININLNKKSRLPTVELFANANYNSFQQGYNNAGNHITNKNLYNGNFGIQISVPLFTGFKISNSISLAKTELYVLNSKIAEQEKQIALEVWNAYQDFLTTVESYNTSFEALKSAEESANISIGMYKNSKASILELLNAQSKYTEAKTNFINNKYNLIINKIKLYRTLGTLNLTNITNIEKL